MRPFPTISIRPFRNVVLSAISLSRCIVIYRICREQKKKIEICQNLGFPHYFRVASSTTQRYISIICFGWLYEKRKKITEPSVFFPVLFVTSKCQQIVSLLIRHKTSPVDLRKSKWWITRTQIDRSISIHFYGIQHFSVYFKQRRTEFCHPNFLVIYIPFISKRFFF